MSDYTAADIARRVANACPDCLHRALTSYLTNAADTLRECMNGAYGEDGFDPAADTINGALDAALDQAGDVRSGYACPRHARLDEAYAQDDSAAERLAAVPGLELWDMRAPGIWSSEQVHIFRDTRGGAVLWTWGCAVEGCTEHGVSHLTPGIATQDASDHITSCHGDN